METTRTLEGRGVLDRLQYDFELIQLFAVDVHLHIIELYLPPLHIFCQLERFCDTAVMNKVRYFCFVLHIPSCVYLDEKYLRSYGKHPCSRLQINYFSYVYL